MAPISRGFGGRRRPVADRSRMPAEQYLTNDFPVLSAGPTPHTAPDEWSFTLHAEVGEPMSWPWEEFLALPSETFTVDIHCVTKWSKLDTSWRGVSLDTFLGSVETEAEYLTAWCDGGYTTNLALEDVTDGRAWVAYEHDSQPLTPEHGGPARLLVPHLYFWKSAKWVRGLTLTADDEPVPVPSWRPPRRGWSSWGMDLVGFEQSASDPQESKRALEPNANTTGAPRFEHVDTTAASGSPLVEQYFPRHRVSRAHHTPTAAPRSSPIPGAGRPAPGCSVNLGDRAGPSKAAP